MNIRTVQPNDPAHLKALFSVLGVSEIAGQLDEPQVMAMYAACGHKEVKHDEVPWCAAGVGWALVQAGLPTSRPIAENLLASSYLKYPGKKYTRADTIPRGAICVWPRAEGSGHVNVCLHDDGENLTLIGCNQANGRGGGVTIVKYSKSSLRGAVLPIYPAGAVPLPKPKPKPAPLPPADHDVEQEDEPAPQRPAPTPPDPPEDQGKPGFFRRVRNWVVGATSGIGGLGFLAYLTDWQVALIFFAAAFLMTWSLIWLVFWLFGKEKVRAWIRKQVGA